MRAGSFVGPVMAILAAKVTLVDAAPAPEVVTVWQTATQVTNDDGSLYTYIAPDASAAGGVNALTTAVTVTSLETASQTSAASPVSSDTDTSGWSLDKLLSSGLIDKWLEYFKNRSSGSTASASTPTSQTTTAAAQITTPGAAAFASTAPSSTSEKHGFLWSLLNHLTDNDSSATASAGIGADSSPTAASSTAYTPAYTTSDSGSGFTSASSSTDQSTSSSTGDVYAAIYDSDDVDEQFARDILDSHNGYRAQHGVAPLSWAIGPYNYAKNNADSYDCSGILTHTHGEYGENLAAGFKTGPSAVKAWYVEGESYDYSTANTYDHFTQVVWKGSKTVGCAYKDCSAEGWAKYIVCEYDPPGNVIGYNKANVLPLTSSSSSSSSS